MNKAKYILLFGVLGAMYNASATDVDVASPGSLSTLVSDPASVTTLKLTGTVNAADLYFIGTNMTSLSTLDLGDVTIAAYEGDMLHGSTTYPEATIPHSAFGGVPVANLTLPRQANLTIGDAAFIGTALSQIALPENIDSIGVGAFASSPNLTEVSLSLAKLGRGVFADCEALTTVNVGYATAVPEDAFRRCTSLTKVNNSDHLISIGDGAFQGCTSLTEFTFGSGLKKLGTAAFAASGITDITSLDQARNLTSIGDYAFAEAKGLEAVTIPLNVESLGHSAFFGAEKVGKLELPEGVTELGDYSLAHAKGVDSIVLPATLIRVGDFAMASMTGLQDINVQQLSSVPETGENVWYGVDQPNVALTVDKKDEDAYRAAPQWQDFKFNVITGVDDVAADATKPALRGRIVGDVIEIEATGADIATANVFDANGRLLTTAYPNASSASIDTTPFATRIYLVSVALDNGTKASLKLAK